MPTKENTTRHRMVVEEVATPKEEEKVEEIKPVEEVKPVEEIKPDILDEGVKAPSQELIDDKALEIAPEKPIVEESKQKSPVFWILIPGIFILGAILGGVVFYQKGVNSTKTAASPSPTTVASAAPTATASPSASVDISKLSVAVFNGSGTAGEAGKVKTLLEKAGFTVSSTGNAATYDYTKTIIKAKSTVDAVTLKKVSDAISGAYVVGDNQTLSSSSTTDIQVVVGSSKAE